MTDNQHSAMLALIVPEIVNHIVKNSNISEEQAVSCFYRSKVYEELADEGSKLWHYSPLLLYTLFQDELLTGSYDYPEGAGL